MLIRQYQQIWDTLKTTSTLSIRVEAPMSTHKRIVQAVRKEKTYDEFWHKQMAQESKNYRLMETIEEDVITFYLKPMPVKSCNYL